MELAGVIGMGPPQEGIQPDLLKYILVKGPEASEQQTGRPTFWVFNQTHEIAVPATVSAEPHVQHDLAVPTKTVDPPTDSAEPHAQPVKAVPNDTAPEGSTVKQSAIMDFFSRRPSTSCASDSTRRVSTPSFITPCPSVNLAEVPAMIEVQSDCNAEDYLDPTHPLFERNVLKPSPELPSVEADSSPAQVDLDIPSPKLPDAATRKAIETKKRFRQYSLPSIVATWHDQPCSRLRVGCRYFATIGQREIAAFDSFSSPPGYAASDSISVAPAEDAKPDDAEADIEKFWIEKDEERLAVIDDMEKTMAGLKAELANTVTAFQMASESNHKLQAEVEKKTTTLSQIEEDMNELLHDLNVADMDNEKLGKDLAHSRIDCKHHSDRAELLRAKAKTESRVITEQREMASEMDFLESQLKERCNSVAHLTEPLSKVADSDRWKDIQGEMEALKTRVDKLPEELQAALNECAKWKKKHDTILEKHENGLVEQASLKEELQSIKDHDLSAMRELKRSQAESHGESRCFRTSSQKCLKQVFERMVCCSLCLETEGYLPSDRKHGAIYERVSELTGKDYQQRLMNFYDDGEHDIQGEFNFGGDGVEDDGDDEGTFFPNNVAQAGTQEPESHGIDQEHTQDSSSAPIPGTTEDGSVNATAMKEPTVPKPGSSNGPAFSAPIFQSSDLPTPAISNGPDVGKHFDFGFSKNPPPSLFVKLIADSETKSGKGSSSSKPLRTSKSAKAITSSTTGKGHSQGILDYTSFGAGESNPFVSKTTSSAELEAKSNAKSFIFNSFSTSEPVEPFAPASENPETERGTKATEAPKEAATSTSQAATFPTQLPDFDFGGNSSPFAFTSSFPSIPAQPGSAGMFSYGKQSAPSMTVQPKEDVVEDGAAKDDNSREYPSKIEVPKSKAPEEEASTFEQTLKVDPTKEEPSQNKKQKQKIPQKQDPPPSHSLKNPSTPSPLPPTRSQKRAAKKAAKKAETKARNAKAQAKRRVEQVMMMR